MKGYAGLYIKTKKAQEQDWDGTLATKLNITNYDSIETLSCVFTCCIQVDPELTCQLNWVTMASCLTF